MMCEVLDNPNTLKGDSWKARTVVEPLLLALERLERGGHTESSGCPLRLRACPDGDLRGKNT